MKTSRQQGKRNQSARRLQNGAVAGCAIILASGAFAQDQTEDVEVVVTGIRKSIQDSIGVKKNESSIVEVVSAEDIGKLPDASIAESIARLPGLTSQRVSGRSNAISIRGFAPARHRRAAHQRSCADAVDPRPGPGLHGDHVQWPRAGVHQ